MCGIAGYFGEGSQQDLDAMIQVISYRGPDGRGTYVGEGIGLAHARLAIIDVSSAANQPMASSDGRYQIVFNGEIYNYIQLKKLVPEYQFRTESDTEVILALFERFGQEAFRMIDGMFAFALYDCNQRTLTLVRDRVGKKPLFWAQFGGTLIFASELEALRAHPLFRRELDLNALRKYLFFEYVPTPHTMLSGVCKVEPASFLTFDGVTVNKSVYWNINLGDNPPIAYSEATHHLDTLLDSAVAKRLVSDRPVGIFLSGGIDSSTVAYYAQKNHSQRIPSFSIAFDEQTFDESRYARSVAAHLGTDHHELKVTSRVVEDALENVAGMLDEPLADPSVIPTHLLSEFTSGAVTVALGGDGGDELLRGYPTFQAETVAGLYQHIPRFARNGLRMIVDALPVSYRNLSADFKAQKFMRGFDVPQRYRHQQWLSSFPVCEQQLLCRFPVTEVYDDIDRYIDEVPHGTAEQQREYVYLRTYLMDDILVKVDRASMRHGLEVRAPFLDTAVVEFVSGLPTAYKQRWFATKRLLKTMMRGRLPDTIIDRRKKGFGLPMAQWLSGDLRQLCESVLSEREITKTGLFNYPYIEQLKRDHFSMRRNNYKELWTLMVFQLWHDKWFAKAP